MKSLKLTLILGLVACMSMIGCHPYKQSEFKTETFEIISFDPPKHVYVDLKRIPDGAIFKRVYVSKHFNNWQNMKIVGKQITVQRTVYTNDIGEAYNSFSGVLPAIKAE